MNNHWSEWEVEGHRLVGYINREYCCSCGERWFGGSRQEMCPRIRPDTRSDEEVLADGFARWINAHTNCGYGVGYTMKSVSYQYLTDRESEAMSRYLTGTSLDMCRDYDRVDYGWDWWIKNFPELAEWDGPTEEEYTELMRRLT